MQDTTQNATDAEKVYAEEGPLDFFQKYNTDEYTAVTYELEDTDTDRPYWVRLFRRPLHEHGGLVHEARAGPNCDPEEIARGLLSVADQLDALGDTDADGDSESDRDGELVTDGGREPRDRPLTRRTGETFQYVGDMIGTDLSPKKKYRVRSITSDYAELTPVGIAAPDVRVTTDELRHHTDIGTVEWEQSHTGDNNA